MFLPSQTYLLARTVSLSREQCHCREPSSLATLGQRPEGSGCSLRPSSQPPQTGCQSSSDLAKRREEPPANRKADAEWPWVLIGSWPYLALALGPLPQHGQVQCRPGETPAPGRGWRRAPVSSQSSPSREESLARQSAVVNHCSENQLLTEPPATGSGIGKWFC